MLRGPPSNGRDDFGQGWEDTLRKVTKDTDIVLTSILDLLL